MLLFFQRHLLISFPWYSYINHFIPTLFFGFVIVEQNYSPNSFFKIGSFRILNWLGKISYGLYLTHMIVIYIVLSVFPHDGSYVLLQILCVVLLTVLISHLSYFYIESFFLSLKNKFSIIKTASPQAA
jgi:peptidoglycan/LPS O-acetylase OafA/YrhL